MNTMIHTRAPRTFSDGARARDLGTPRPRARLVRVGVEPTTLHAETPTPKSWDFIVALPEPMRTRAMNACKSGDQAEVDATALYLEGQGQAGAANAVRAQQCVENAPSPTPLATARAAKAAADKTAADKAAADKVAADARARAAATTKDKLAETARSVGMIAGPPLIGYLLLGASGALIGVAASGAIYWFGMRQAAAK